MINSYLCSLLVLALVFMNCRQKEADRTDTMFRGGTTKLPKRNLGWMEVTVSVTMTNPSIGKWHTGDQDGHTTPKVIFSSL